MNRSPKGMPVTRSSNGRLQVHVTFKGKRHIISLGLPDTERNRNSAQKLRERIEDDLSRFRFDETLERYYQEFSAIKRRSENAIAYLDCLSEVWNKYESFKEGQVEQTTIDIYFAGIRSAISKLPTTSLKKAVQIRDYLLEHHSAATAKKTLQAFSTACRWAYESGLIEDNPFLKLSRTISRKKNEEETDIDPFSEAEIKTVLEAFYTHPLHGFYYNYLRFLFATGCRTSEAIGLKWEDIGSNRINFCRALVQTPRGHVEKGLKSQERRYFNLNEVLTDILKEQDLVRRNEFVFPGKNAKHIVRNNFTNQVWKGSKARIGVVSTLADKGLIDHYRPQYQTRHTFITLALEKGLDVKDVARLVGNTPEIIYKHYAGSKRDLEVPSLF